MGVLNRLVGRVDRRAVLLGRMLRRIGVDPAVAAREGLGTRFATAARNCVCRGRIDECQAWLDGAARDGPPAFCPNARTLRDWRRFAGA